MIVESSGFRPLVTTKDQQIALCITCEQHRLACHNNLYQHMEVGNPVQGVFQSIHQKMSKQSIKALQSIFKKSHHSCKTIIHKAL
jgi:hypothetical protein